MRLTDLSLTPNQKMREINSYLKENFGYTLNADKFDQAKVARALSQLQKQQWDLCCSVKNYQNNSEYVKSVMIAESLRIMQGKKKQALSESVARLQMLVEQDLEQAEVALAAKGMAEDVKEMAEKIAKMQVETLMALVDTMKETHGTAEAEQFNTTVEGALQTLLDTLKQTHDAISNAAGVVAGDEAASMQEPAAAPAPEMDMGDDLANAPELDMDNAGMGGAEAASGPAAEPTGRELK